jgi:hypothetical protein
VSGGWKTRRHGQPSTRVLWCQPLARNQLLGDCSAGVPPVPIPNTEVKPCSPDGTARASGWESRTLPELKKESPVRNGRAFLLQVRVPSQKAAHLHHSLPPKNISQGPHLGDVMHDIIA